MAMSNRPIDIKGDEEQERKSTEDKKPTEPSRQPSMNPQSQATDGAAPSNIEIEDGSDIEEKSDNDVHEHRREMKEESDNDEEHVLVFSIALGSNPQGVSSFLPLMLGSIFYEEKLLFRTNEQNEQKQGQNLGTAHIAQLLGINITRRPAPAPSQSQSSQNRPGQSGSSQRQPASSQTSALPPQEGLGSGGSPSNPPSAERPPEPSHRSGFGRGR